MQLASKHLRHHLCFSKNWVLGLLLLGTVSLSFASGPFPAEVAKFFPVGRTFTGVKIPSYSDNDELQTVMEADTITRVDSNFFDISNLTVKIYEKGKVTSTISMKNAKYDILANTLKSEESEPRPKVNHPSFTMTGDQMIVDTVNQVSTMKGRVKVVIPNAKQFTGNFGMDELSK